MTPHQETRGGGEPAALVVEDRIFRALAVLRAVLVLNTVGVGVWTADELDRPWVGALAISAIVLWSVAVTAAYADAARRTPLLLAADLAVALAALLATPLVKADGFDATLAGYWVMSPMFAWAARWGWRGGLAAGLSVGAADLLIRDELTQVTYGNVFLLAIGGPVVGYLVESLQRSAVQRDRAEREAAAAAERARLARAVHDGVLQVLALVQRRGGETAATDPRLAELGRLAGEQEEALRALIRAQDRVVPPAAGGGAAVADLAAALATLESPRVVVSLPGGTVPLPEAQVAEVRAAVAACLDNVERHAGPEARAWVLLESLPGAVTVSVRDDGPGIPEGRLARASAEGRLGVTGSIEGRLRDLGGRADLATGSWGTEWTLTLPVAPAVPPAGGPTP
ncbi:MacS family sensor histidine kinase [Nocardioides ginkgobilobae]